MEGTESNKIIKENPGFHMNLVEKLWWPKFGDNESLCLHNITIDIFIGIFECVLYFCTAILYYILKILTPLLANQ